MSLEDEIKKILGRSVAVLGGRDGRPWQLTSGEKGTLTEAIMQAIDKDKGDWRTVELDPPLEVHPGMEVYKISTELCKRLAEGGE